MPFALAKAKQLSEILAAEVLLLPLNSAEMPGPKLVKCRNEICWSPLLYASNSGRERRKIPSLLLTQTEEVSVSIINAWAEAGIILPGLDKCIQPLFLYWYIPLS